MSNRIKYAWFTGSSFITYTSFYRSPGGRYTPRDNWYRKKTERGYQTSANNIWDHGDEMKVYLSGWSVGLQVVSLIEAIDSYSKIGLMKSKKKVDDLLDGHIIEIEISDKDLLDFKNRCYELGAICKDQPE